MSVRSGSLAASEHDEADLHQVLTHRRLTTETQASGQDSTRVERRGKIKSTTTRVVKKTTTVTRGDQRMVAEAILRTSDTHQEDINKVVPQSGWHTSSFKRPKIQAVCLDKFVGRQGSVAWVALLSVTPDTRAHSQPHQSIKRHLEPAH